MNKTHGHVIPNLDGSLARCGGPKHCSICGAEWGQVQARAAEMHKNCTDYWARLPRDIQVTQHGADAHYEDARLAIFQERYPPARPARPADRPTPEAGSSTSPLGESVQSADDALLCPEPQTHVHGPGCFGPEIERGSLRTEAERRLFMILVEHDVAIADRNAQRTETVWPDLSDIHIETRRKIFDLFRVRDVLNSQDQTDLPLDLIAESKYLVRGQQAFSIKPESPIDPGGYLNRVVLINGRRYRVTNVERRPVFGRVNSHPFGLLVIPA